MLRAPQVENRWFRAVCNILKEINFGEVKLESISSKPLKEKGFSCQQYGWLNRQEEEE